ncbi:MAG TPA: acetyl-CoA carboxylase carboxyltransferase subunit alpha [Pyrinomonadaceae bacterium]|jgi:acetyl-CoA carboxylase carboxyl transferase subunit alpha
MQNEITSTAIERVQTARHPERPYSMDIFLAIFGNFVEIHGDRRYADDAALVCGFATLDDKEVVVIGQQKGRDTNQRRFRNFGMPKPEGYRKALRTMKLAEKFKRPIISFIDTPGAYPGIDAEERGQAEAIAFNLREMASLRVPIIVVVIGEGGSGGALAIGVGDRVLMMENSIYSVISPEGCAAILWKDAGQSARAAECLRLTATDLHKFGLVDEIIPELSTWALDDVDTGVESESEKISEMKFEKTSQILKKTILRNLKELSDLGEAKRHMQRYQKFRMMGEWIG